MDHPVYINATSSFTIRENKYVRTRYLNELRHRKLKTTFLISLILCTPSSSGILNGHTSGFPVGPLQKLKNFPRNFFSTMTVLFSYYFASHIKKKKLKTFKREIYVIFATANPKWKK